MASGCVKTLDDIPLAMEVKTVSFTIRPATTTDYPAIAAVAMAALPGTMTRAEDIAESDSHLAPHCKAGRYVAEIAGKVVGVGEYVQYEGRYHPQKFNIRLFVHPSHQGQGIGTGLYQQVREAIAPFDPIALSATIREDQPRSIAFATKHGFVERMRTWEVELNLATFDPAPWLPYLEQAATAGVTIKSLRELESDPERNQRLFAAFSAIRMDVPSADPRTPLDFARFVKSHLESSDTLPDGYFVALSPSGEYIGQTALWKDAGDGILHTGVTGLLPEWRGKGIAQALKVRALTWAKEQGAKGVITFNESNNIRMLKINLAMGFVQKPAWIDAALTIQAG